jgi:hypothetical protein
MVFDAIPDLLIVHAASLDEPDRFEPGKVMFSSSAPAWDVVDPDLPKFAKMPPR